MERNRKITKVLSFAIILSMVFTGLFVVAPLAPETTEKASAQLPEGPDYSHADGHWDWGGSYGNEVLLAGQGAGESTTEPHDVLVIMDNFYYRARPNYAYDYYYNRLKPLVDDIHANDLTVDTWFCYPYISGHHNYRDGYYDSIARFNYYPSSEILDNYGLVIIWASSSMYGGIYYYYDSPRYSTQQETFTTLSDWMDNGGNVWLTTYTFNYITRVYSWANYLGPYGDNWVKNYLGIWSQGYVNYHYGYRIQGVDGTMGDGIGPTSYPTDYVYTYGYAPRIMNTDTVMCYYASYGTGTPSTNYPVGYQTDSGTWKSAVTFDVWYLRYVWPTGYRPGISDTTRAVIVEQALDFLYSPAAAPGAPVPNLYPTEIQTGNGDNSNEWIELANTINKPINLYELYLSKEDGSGGAPPTTYFANKQDLHEYGVPAELNDHTFYLNAESLYIDNYYDDIYLYKDLSATTGNTYGTVYTTDFNGNSDWTVWYNESSDQYMTEGEVDATEAGYLDDIYQITLPDILLVQKKWAKLDGAWDEDCTVYDYNPGGSVKELDFANDLDLDTYVGGFDSATLEDFYRTSSAYEAGKWLYFTTDPDVSPYFWEINVPHIIFVNDNHYPTEHIYYSHVDGEEKTSGGSGIVDIYFPDHMDHYTNPAYFEDDSISYGGTTVDYTDSEIRDQITVVEIEAPILNDEVYVNKNTGDFATGPGTNIVKIVFKDQIGVFDETAYMWLFPVGSTYKDYNDLVGGEPKEKDLKDTIVVEDISDSDDELPANGIIYIWNATNDTAPVASFGWGTNGPAPEPVPSWSAQAYFDGTSYNFAQWTLGDESKGEHNSVPAPAYGSVDVVINEINPSYVELYNRGGAPVTVSGWTLTGATSKYSLSGTIAPGSFMVITDAYFSVPNKPGSGGRVSLLDDLGVIVSSIGYINSPTGSNSFVARHLDGVGVDYGYNETMLQPSLSDSEAQPNADWDVNVPYTQGTSNYDGVTILQIGKMDQHSPWSLVENISNYNPAWAGGTLGTNRADDMYLNNWDVIFSIGGVSTSNAAIFDDYIMSGGRLYVENSDWSTLDGTDFYTDIGISAVSGTTNPAQLTGAEPITEGMNYGYTHSVGSRFIPNEDTFTVWSDSGYTYAVLYVYIDTDNPDNSYRVVASAARYKYMSPMDDELYNFTGKVMDYFLMSDDEINHAPEVEIIGPKANALGEEPLFKGLPTLNWENNDIDVWDQIPGAMKYTLYISTDQTAVNNMDASARSASFVGETSTSTVVTAIDAPAAGIYYWGIFAEDKYGKTTYVHDGVFKYDSDAPYVTSVVAISDNVEDDPLPAGGTPRVFGPAYHNSAGQQVGRPEMFAITLGDNFGLKFSNNHNTAELMTTDSYTLPNTVFSCKVMYYYAGQYEDDLPTFNLYVDEDGTNGDLESLTGSTTATIYMIPDGQIPDGDYHLYVIAGDEVRWGSYMDYFFSVDLTPPEAPIDITISPETYVDPITGDLFVKAGDAYTLSATAPSSSDDASMSKVVFQQAVANYEGVTWEEIGTDSDVGDNTYSVTWTPDTTHYYIRAVAWDYVGNYAESEVFDDFHVDGAAPQAPDPLQATLNLEHSPVAEVSGYVMDTIVEGQTSGVDYVVLYLNDEPVTDPDTGEVVHVPVVDYQFDYDVPLEPIDREDRPYTITARAYDHVGNEGPMSDPAIWTNTGSDAPIRIIRPSDIEDVSLEEDVPNPDDSLDEVRSITVTFLDAPTDYQTYQMVIKPGTLRTGSDASSLGLPSGTKYLYNYFIVEIPPEFSGFTAQVSIVFHLSPRSQLGPTTEEILSNIRIVTKHSGENNWEVLEMIGGGPQVVDPTHNLYRVTARVNRFSSFALIVAQTDLTVKDITLGANPAIAAQNLTITVTVHNGGDFPRTADNVKVKLYSIDEDGNQEYIGELDYGSIDPTVDYYPNDASLVKGDKKATLHWETPAVGINAGETRTYIIKAEVDPDGYVRETNELNNARTESLEVVGAPVSSPSFGMTYVMMAFAAMMVAGLSVYSLRKRD